MRVALISSSYHPYPGGVEEHTANVAREFEARGIEVAVWTVDRGEHLGRQQVDGIDVLYLPTPLPARSGVAAIRFARDLPRAWRAWMAAFRAFRPDLLHVQCFGPNGIYALALHHRTGVPLVVSSHGETFADDRGIFSRSRLLRAGLVRALRDANAVTGCSQMVLDDLAGRFECGAGVVVPNGVDLDEAARVGPATLPYDDAAAPTVLAIGRVERNKGFDLLLHAFARAELPIAARLVIGGDGTELPHLVRLAGDLGIERRVVFPGRLSRAQVLAGMAAATVIAVPSRVEAFGIVVLEAWRSGRPLIATTLGGPAELVTDGVDGLLVDPTDEQAFAAVLTRLVSDPELGRRLGERGRETVTKYTWEKVADRYLELYGVARSSHE